MPQYLSLIHGNSKSSISKEEWNQFFRFAQQSGFFLGGSEIGERIPVGRSEPEKSSDHIVGYMLFQADEKQQVLDLLESHPVVIHGGSVELCELPEP